MGRRTPSATVGTWRDRGAATVEYVGIIIAVAVLLGVVLVASSSVGSSLADKVEEVACKITGQTGCGSTGQAGGSRNEPRQGQYANAFGHEQTADAARVSTGLDDLRDALDGGWFGVRSGDLADARKVIEGLNGAEIDALIAQMSDDELRAWVKQLNDRWPFGGWDVDQRRELWELLATRASKDTIDRMARFTDELNPSFHTVGDRASDDPDSLANTGRYGELPHQLVVDGADPMDVSQGRIGDCWWIASMMAVAQANPQVIEEAITLNPNGTYTVRLYDDGNPVYVTVTPDMVLNPDGTPAFVGNNGQAQGTYELWPMVLEKAIALRYGSFGNIEGGWPSVGLATLTGIPSTDVSGRTSLQDLRDVLDDGGAVGLISITTDKTDHPLYAKSVPPAQRLRTFHAYYVSDVDVDAGTVTVVNPWGLTQFPPLTLTYEDFVSAFPQVATNEVTR